MKKNWGRKSRWTVPLNIILQTVTRRVHSCCLQLWKWWNSVQPTYLLSYLCFNISKTFAASTIRPTEAIFLVGHTLTLTPVSLKDRILNWRSRVLKHQNLSSKRWKYIFCQTGGGGPNQGNTNGGLDHPHHCEINLTLILYPSRVK